MTINFIILNVIIIVDTEIRTSWLVTQSQIYASGLDLFGGQSVCQSLRCPVTTSDQPANT